MKLDVKSLDIFGGNLPTIRFNWKKEEVKKIHDLSFPDILFFSHSIHRYYFNPSVIESAALLSIKTGGCPEDCGYCSQSSHHETSIKATKLMDIESVVKEAKKAKLDGAIRFCMGAAWRSPKNKDLNTICEMIRRVKMLGLETCATLGMLTSEQACQLSSAGLDYYNHNIDTSSEYYSEIITTRNMEDRLKTISYVRSHGIKVCCGGIFGIGETLDDQISMLTTLSTLPEHPQSVPLNLWNEIHGTPVLEKSEPIKPIAFIKLVALSRILMPKSIIRLSAGRSLMSDEMQGLCFFAGANSIFKGDMLLTTKNSDSEKDKKLFEELGISISSHENFLELRM